MKMKIIIVSLAIAAALWQTAIAQTSPDLKWMIPTPEISALAFAPNDSYLVAGCRNFELRFYNVETGEILDSLMLPDWPFDIKFTHDGTKLCVGMNHNKIAVYDAVTHVHLKTMEVSGTTAAEYLTISFDDKYISYSGSTNVVIWDLTDYTLKKTIDFEVKEFQNYFKIEGIGFTPDLNYLMVYWYRSFSKLKEGYESEIEYYDVNTFTKITPAPKKGIKGRIIFSNTGKYIGSKPWDLIVYEYETGNIVLCIPTFGDPFMDFSNDDQYLVYSIYDFNIIKIYNIISGDFVKSFSTEPKAPLSYIKISSSNYIAATTAINAPCELVLFNSFKTSIDESNPDEDISLNVENGWVVVMTTKEVIMPVKVTIYDIIGNTIYKHSISELFIENKYTLNADFHSGLYICKVISGEKVYTFKLNITR
jgi:WD40 repeat protein